MGVYQADEDREVRGGKSLVSKDFGFYSKLEAQCTGEVHQPVLWGSG